MAKIENLFFLIKSMTKNEKRHFKLFSKNSEKKNNYHKLFDFIDKMDIYDESKVKRKFSNEKFVTQLHVTKNYLIKLILKSLKIYHSKISADSEIKEISRNVEILFYKEQYSLAKDELKRGIKLANEYEVITAVIELLEWKRKLLLAKGNSFQFNKEIIQINDQKIIAINKQKENVLYMDIALKMLSTFSSKNKAEFFNNNLLKNIKDNSLVHSKVLYHHIHYAAEMIRNNYEQAEYHLDKQIEILESNGHLITENPDSYITALNNKITYMLSFGYHYDVPALIRKIKHAPKLYKIKKKLTVKLLVRTYNIELELYRDNNQIQEAKNLILEIQDFVTDHFSAISPDYLSLLYYQTAHIYFKSGDLRESMKWINKLLAGDIETSREDILSYTRFLNLIIHFELKNRLVLKYSVEAFRRFLKKKRELFHFEKVLLKYFAKLSMAPESKEKEILKKLKDELFAHTDSSKKKEALDYFNFIAWIDSHIH